MSKSILETITEEVANHFVLMEEQNALQCVLDALRSGDFYAELKLEPNMVNQSKYYYEPHRGMNEVKKILDDRIAIMDEMAECLKMSLKIIRRHENPELPGSAELRSISAIIDLYEEMKGEIK